MPQVTNFMLEWQITRIEMNVGLFLIPTESAFSLFVNRTCPLPLCETPSPMLNMCRVLTFCYFPDKELSACKERQEIELAAQRATLQEQRTHIDILDTALTNAQGNVVGLEEEVKTSSSPKKSISNSCLKSRIVIF